MADCTGSVQAWGRLVCSRCPDAGTLEVLIGCDHVHVIIRCAAHPERPPLLTLHIDSPAFQAVLARVFPASLATVH